MLPRLTIYIKLKLVEISLICSKANTCTADWTQEEAEVPGNTTHLWEESWDDDDTSEDFSAQLKYAYLSASQY